MWPVIMGVLRTYAVYITWPVAAVVGFIGYNIETKVRKEKSPWRVQSVEEDRGKRQLEEIAGKDCSEVESLKSKKDLPRSAFGRND